MPPFHGANQQTGLEMPQLRHEIHESMEASLGKARKAAAHLLLPALLTFVVCEAAAFLRTNDVT